MFHQAKKRFGQHFLKDKHIAEKICEALTGMVCEDTSGMVCEDTDHGKGDGPGKGMVCEDTGHGKGNSNPIHSFSNVLEVGPGLGVLTQFLYPVYNKQLYLVEIDGDFIPALKKDYPNISEQIFEQDFLELDIESIFKTPVAIIGNFPYNISSQILFKIVENRKIVPIMVGMFQKEVALRVAAVPGNKIYGLLSVWVQCFYDIEYLFTVNEGSFSPPPKVKSAVIRLSCKETEPDCDAKLLLQIIKAAFNQRRKTLRNALGAYKNQFDKIEDQALLDKRAETLGWEQYVKLARLFGK